MGLFSNGSEGMDYQYHYCDRCSQYRERESDPAPDMGDGCPIWDLHLTYNGEDSHQQALDMLIPRIKGKWRYNGRCNFFTPENAEAEAHLLEYEAQVAAYQHETPPPRSGTGEEATE